MNVSAEEFEDRTSARKAPRSWRLLPRFGLRSLFVLGVIFSLLCGFVARNLYRERHREAALERLLAAEAYLTVETDAATSYGRLGETEFDPQIERGSPTLGTRLAIAFGLKDAFYVRGVHLPERYESDVDADVAMRAASSFPEVESIGLEGFRYSDASIALISRFPNLRELSLLSVSISAEEMETLASLKTLEDVCLVGVETQEDGGAGALATLPRLRKLQIISGDFTDEDAACFSEAFCLHELRSINTQMTDAGVAALLPSASLRRLAVSEPVTFEAARRFSETRPECIVVHRPRGGFDLKLKAGKRIPL